MFYAVLQKNIFQLHDGGMRVQDHVYIENLYIKKTIK